jgi:Uncharacterized conserved protein
MKKTLSLFIIFCCQVLVAHLTTNEVGWVLEPNSRAARRARESPIPLQAGICDIIGIGFVSAVEDAGGLTRVSRIEVANYWLGNPGSNTLFIAAHTNPPVDAHVPILFFANSYHLPDMGPSRSERRFQLLPRISEFRREKWRRSQPVFHDGERSWFRCSDENVQLVDFASNLVAAAQISTNSMAYYELIRDGYRSHSPISQIRIESEMSLWNCEYWMSTNMMRHAWEDPLLEGHARDAVNNAFYSLTGEFFLQAIP